MSHDIKELFTDIFRALYAFFSHRILWLLVVTAILFYILLAQLFQLQIVSGETFRAPPPRTGYIYRDLPAPRGTIYDRHGRPLAQNVITRVAKMDPSIHITNEALLKLAQIFIQNGDDYIDSFPICVESFEFTITGTTEEQIRRRQQHWMREMYIPNFETATAREAWDFLRETRFNIDPELSDADARRIMNFRAKIFERRFLGFGTYEPTPILFARDISPATIAAIGEKRNLFAGLFVDIETTRVYPAGRYVSHMIGYLRPITAQQYADNYHLGYTQDCLFGRAGLELSMEHSLRGTPGEERFRVDSAGRRISTPERISDPQPGDRIFLTIDLELQIAAFHELERALSEAVIGRLNLARNHDQAVTVEEAFISFVNANNLDIRRVLEVDPDNHAYAMQRYIVTRFPDVTAATATTLENRERIQDIITDGIQRRRVSPAMMLLTLIGTEQITDPDGTIAERLTRQPGSARDVLIEKIRARELTPQLLNIDPATGSLVITCIHTGAVLAAVTYPSYDNNRLVNSFDNEYFIRINSLDPTHPMINRPFRETNAPGSTFKMFTGVAGLEAGVIGPTTRITDRIRFTSAGEPGVRCWHGGGHGTINVTQAVAVSCNYFFAETAFRLGNARPATARTTAQGIEIFNRYMAMFGLNEATGVEIGDHPISLRAAGYHGDIMAGPEFKRHRILALRPFAPASSLNWFDGDTVQASIGQGYVDVTTAQMVRGMATIANRGVNYQLFLVGHKEDANGNVTALTTPTAMDHGMDVADSTWDAIIEGMRLATQPGAGGTAVGVFRGFPVVVAGKTGTAEHGQARLNHSTFGAFAPHGDPQIATFVFIPFGTTAAYSQISARISREIIGIALGIDNEPQHPEPLNNLRR